MKRKKYVTLRFSILSIYTVTFIVLISIIISVSSVFFFRSITYFANSLLKDTSALIMQELKFKGNSPEILVGFTRFLFENGYIDDDQIIKYSLSVAQHTLHFQLPYPTRIVNWNDAKGSTVATYLEADGTFSTVIIKPQAHPPVYLQLFRNKAGDVIKSKTIAPEEFNDNKQFLSTIKAKHFLWTDAFFSFPSRNLATAAVTPIYNKAGQFMGVFSVYIAMEGVSEYLSTLKIGKNGIAFMINGHNELIAFPGMQKWMANKNEKTKLLALGSRGETWLKYALDYYNTTHKNQFVFEYNNARYIASIEDLPEELPEVAAYGWKVGVVVPESDFTGDLEKKNMIIIFTGILTLLMGITLASIFSKRLAARIKLLVHETERIKNFHFGSKKIMSIIKEVDSLANAIHSMKMNLRAFQKYMPANLVRKLIKTGEDIQVGGEKKTLSILFTDIKNFTSITETMDPEELLPHLCEYLENLTRLISQNHGTIDKFIGDSIMAFWGAPITDKDHCEHACRTALLCKNKINELNQTWIKKNRPPFITRFGLHTGEVIVGNIGSSERMNYTALGDAINLASRLEGVNKIYGTSIIASEKVKELVGTQFIFRKIDETKIKGKIGKYNIYELLAEHSDELSFDLRSYQFVFDKGFIAMKQRLWIKAIDFFKQALAVYPKDTVTPMLIARCKKSMKNS